MLKDKSITDCNEILFSYSLMIISLDIPKSINCSYSLLIVPFSKSKAAFLESKHSVSYELDKDFFEYIVL